MERQGKERRKLHDIPLLHTVFIMHVHKLSTLSRPVGLTMLTGVHSKHGILLPLQFHCYFSYAPQGATYHLTLYCCLHSVVRFHILFISTQCAAQALDYVQAIVDKAVTESHCRDDYNALFP